MPGVRFASPGDLRGPHTSGPNVRIVVNELTSAGRNARIALAAAAAVALLAAGCGASEGGEYGGEHPDYARALAGSPGPLAALHAQGSRLLGGGADAYERRIAALRGYPVVVNLWASWCGPCRFEFPTLQRLAAGYGKRVAFLGVDSQDSDDAARTFLEEAPVPYPSYTDPDAEIKDSLGTRGFPDTAFYDRRGELVHLKQGPYTDPGELRADLERYALESG
jgi:cytochrome c biogenesis protein CcmG/thiol:disulfide interchange protein DsbE